jgi:hypothetical protein
MPYDRHRGAGTRACRAGTLPGAWSVRNAAYLARESRGKCAASVIASVRTLASHEMKDATKLAVGVSSAGFKFDGGRRRHLR